MKRMIISAILLIALAIPSLAQNPGWIDKGEYLELDTALTGLVMVDISADGNQFYTYTNSDILFSFWDLETGTVEKTHKITYTNQLRGINYENQYLANVNVNYDDKFINFTSTKRYTPDGNAIDMFTFADIYDLQTGILIDSGKKTNSYSYSDNYDVNHYFVYDLQIFENKSILSFQNRIFDRSFDDLKENAGYTFCSILKNYDYYLAYSSSVNQRGYVESEIIFLELQKSSNLSINSKDGAQTNSIISDRGRVRYGDYGGMVDEIDTMRRVVRAAFFPNSKNIGAIINLEDTKEKLLSFNMHPYDSLYIYDPLGVLIKKVNNLINPDYFSFTWDDNYVLTSHRGKIYTLLIIGNDMQVVDSSDFQHPEKKEWEIMALDDKKSFLCTAEGKIIRYFPELKSTVFEKTFGNISIYPNPADEALLIDLGDAANVRIELIDILGRKLISRELSGGQIRLSTDGIPPGMYFLRIQHGKDIITKKIMIAH